MFWFEKVWGFLSVCLKKILVFIFGDPEFETNIKQKKIPDIKFGFEDLASEKSIGKGHEEISYKFKLLFPKEIIWHLEKQNQYLSITRQNCNPLFLQNPLPGSIHFFKENSYYPHNEEKQNHRPSDLENSLNQHAFFRHSNKSQISFSQPLLPQAKALRPQRVFLDLKKRTFAQKKLDVSLQVIFVSSVIFAGSVRKFVRQFTTVSFSPISEIFPEKPLPISISRLRMPHHQGSRFSQILDIEPDFEESSDILTIANPSEAPSTLSRTENIEQSNDQSVKHISLPSAKNEAKDYVSSEIESSKVSSKKEESKKTPKVRIMGMGRKFENVIEPLKRGGAPRGEREKSLETTPESDSPDSIDLWIEIVCLKVNREWVVGLEIQNPEALEGNESFSIFQEVAAKRVDLNILDNYPSVYLIPEPSAKIKTTFNGDINDLPLPSEWLFKLNANEKGHRISQITIGSFLIISTGELSVEGAENVYSPRKSEQVLWKGHWANFVCVDSAQRKIEFTDSQGAPFHLEGKANNVSLMGNRLVQHGSVQVPLFGGALPILYANNEFWNEISEIVIGEEGEGKKSWKQVPMFPHHGSERQDFPEEMENAGAGWFFVRIYKRKEGALPEAPVESLSFKWIKDISEIRVDPEKFIPGKDGYSETQVVFLRDQNVGSIECLDKRLSRSESGNGKDIYVIPPKPDYDLTEWKYTHDTSIVKPVSFEILLGRLWWRKGLEGQEENGGWTCRPISVPETSFKATSKEVIVFKLPTPRWTREIQIGLSKEKSGPYKVSGTQLEIRLRDFWNLLENESPFPQIKLKCWYSTQQDQSDFPVILIVKEVQEKDLNLGSDKDVVCVEPISISNHTSIFSEAKNRLKRRDFEKAEKLAIDLISFRERHFGPFHESTLQAQYFLSKIYRAQNNNRKGHDENKIIHVLLEKMKNIQDSTLKKSPIWAAIIKRSNDLLAAIPIEFQPVLDFQNLKFRSSEIELFVEPISISNHISKFNEAKIRLKRRDFEKSEKLAIDLISFRERHFGIFHESTLQAQYLLSMIFRAQKSIKEKKILIELLKILNKREHIGALDLKTSQIWRVIIERGKDLHISPEIKIVEKINNSKINKPKISQPKKKNKKQRRHGHLFPIVETDTKDDDNEKRRRGLRHPKPLGK